MLSVGATFVARVYADTNQISWVVEEAMKHKGFSFIEVIQPCVTFHPDKGYKEKTYDLQKKGHDKSNYKKAMEKAEEFDYDGLNEKSRIPLGIFYQTQKPTFEDKFPQLQNLKKKKISWRDIPR